ncbi:MAG: translation initiation factor IF-2 [Rhodospirillales bacterium]|nr:MAG: translation initiation factor IF-2 [Rhodospirillales bacterium]
MTESHEDSDKKPEQESPGRKLELKKTVETGQVRQSFSHGRSKMVRVEVRKKRTYAPDARGRMTKAGLDGGARDEAKGRDRGAVGLTTAEKASRARALQDAFRADETQAAVMDREEPALEAERPAQEVTPETGAETAPEAGPEAVPETGPKTGPDVMRAPETKPEEAAAELAAEPVSEVPTLAPTEPTAKEAEGEPAVAKPAPEPEKPKAAPARPGVAKETETASEESPAKRSVRADVRRPAPTAPRKGEPKRRAGKLTVTEALEDRTERVRSLAAVRRAREKERNKQRGEAGESQKVVRDVVIPETITVQDLSNRMAERNADVIKALMRMGVMATLNQAIDADTAELLATEFGHNVKRVSEADVEIGLKGEEDVAESLQPRAPVVTVMGHVDHGKTSLLDALRRTDVAGHEAGGITQHIGAYQITLPDGDQITFIDTPGHEAFTEMRARGANVTDIVVLVVAADDGVMPQTIEAIRHAQAAKVPIIVAINKIDRPDANPLRVRNELLQHDVVTEDVGGETLSVEVSAKAGTNLDKLVDAILLQAEVLDLQANPDRPAEGVIVESRVERGRGSVATVLVQRGTLKVGDIFVAGQEWGRVRGLTDAGGTALESAGPGVPVEVLGLNGTPAAGDDVAVVESEARAREVTEFRQRKQREMRTAAAAKRTTFEQMFERIREGESKSLAVVVKADVHGSSEAICGALEKLSTSEVGVQVLHSGVGGINESDVTLAHASEGIILGFNVRANPQARELAKRDGVEVRYYSIIYDLVDDMRQVLSGLLSPQLRENILGYAQVRQVFTITKVGKVAGCMVTEGVIRRGAKVRLLRDDVVIHEGDLSQLKRFKEDVREVREGYDCGVALANYQDIQVGDVIECFEVQEVARHL